MRILSLLSSAFLLLFAWSGSSCQRDLRIQSTYIGHGFAETQVNAVIFRKNALVSRDGRQYAAYYDSSGQVVMAHRSLDEAIWTVVPTAFRGDPRDAHNSISLMVDGAGYLHLSWDHHGDPLRYARSRSPHSLDFERLDRMIGTLEEHVTYPEFHALPSGDMLFLYRDGGSGNGNLVLNRYRLSTQDWERVHDNLLDGEGKRNAYWQAFVGPDGMFHLSWVWRETGDVTTNHDMAYALSADGGQTWSSIEGQSLGIPIRERTAPYAMRIPQGSNLTNQTSMVADASGRPYIATFMKLPDDPATQFYVIYHNGRTWNHSQVSSRTLDFPLGGYGTRSTPISRPQVLVEAAGSRPRLHLVYRDEEHGNRVCLASTRVDDAIRWEHRHLSAYGMNRWEPVYDTERWKSAEELHILLQRVAQGSGETPIPMPPTPIYLLTASRL